MQMVFVVISDNDVSLDNMKVFNRRQDAHLYQINLKDSTYSNAVVYEREVM